MPVVLSALPFREPTRSGTGVPPVRTRRPTHGRDARATSLRADLEVRAPISRFRVPMHSKKRKGALHEPPWIYRQSAERRLWANPNRLKRGRVAAEQSPSPPCNGGESRGGRRLLSSSSSPHSCLAG